METSAYQGFKPVVLDILALSKDAVHIHVGLVVFLLAVVLWRRGRLDRWSLLPVLLAAGAMEAQDLRDDLVSLGYMRWSASVHDFVNTVFWPTMAVISGKWLDIRKDRRQ
ncbi:MAG: hypothetical protein WC247_14230 [Porticoccaceae bacterium]